MSARHPVEKSCDLPETHPYNLQQALERFERGYIANMLELTRWNHRKTAQMLGISPDLLAAKIHYYQLGSSPAASCSAEQQFQTTSLKRANLEEKVCSTTKKDLLW